MATLDAVFVPFAGTPTCISGLSASTASGVVTLGNRTVFAINSTQDMTISFGLSTGTGGAAVPTPTASYFRVPANCTFVFDLGTNFDSIQVYNLSATNASNVYIQPLSKF
jgi:hypothetical protein